MWGFQYSNAQRWAGCDDSVQRNRGQCSGFESSGHEIKTQCAGAQPSGKEAAEKASQLIDRTTLSVVGPAIPRSGASAWSELVKSRPVPFECDSRDICLHPVIVAAENKFKLYREAANT